MIRNHGSVGIYKRISAAAFCHHFRLGTQKGTIKFEEPEITHDGLMRLSLETAARVTRGAR